MKLTRKRIQEIRTNATLIAPFEMEDLCGLALSSLDQGWRDVRQELPEENSTVLCFTKSGSQMVALHETTSDKRFTWYTGGGYRFPKDFVTHWRELPKGPAVDGETKTNA